MCSGSEAGPYLRLIDFVYHATLGLRVIKKKKKRPSRPEPPPPHSRSMGSGSNSHGARPVHLIISIIQWIRTSRLSIANSLSGLKLALRISQTFAALMHCPNLSDSCHNLFPSCHNLFWTLFLNPRPQQRLVPLNGLKFGAYPERVMAQHVRFLNPRPEQHVRCLNPNP